MATRLSVKGMLRERPNIGVIEARGIPSGSNPFCSVRVGNQKKSTRHLRNTSNPAWHESLSLYKYKNSTYSSFSHWGQTNANVNHILIKVRSKQFVPSHKLIGCLEIDTSGLGVDIEEIEKWFPILKGSALNGEIRISVMLQIGRGSLDSGEFNFDSDSVPTPPVSFEYAGEDENSLSKAIREDNIQQVRALLESGFDVNISGL